MSKAKPIADGLDTALENPVSLFNIRNKLRIGPDLIDYGIASSGVVDYGQSDFDSLVTGLVSDGQRDVYVPPGNYRLGEQITIQYGITLTGQSKSHSVFKMYHPNSGFVFTGAQENGGGISKLSIVNDSGSQVTAYLQLIASVAGTAPDFFTVDDCNMTGFSGATTQYGIISNGNARDGSAPNALIGNRTITVRDTQIFNCDILNVDLRNTRNFVLFNVGNFQAGGAVTKVSISGATAGTGSYNGRMIGCTLGDLSIDHASLIIGSANDINDVTVTANCTTSHFGFVKGSVSNSSLTTKIDLI